MPAITTTRVCSSIADVDNEWAIVAEYPGRLDEQCVSGWRWHMPLKEVGEFLVARDDDGWITTTQGRTGDFTFALYAKLSRDARRVRRAA